MFKRKAILLSIDFLRRFSCGFCPLECFRVGDMIKRSSHLIFNLQMYISMQSPEDEEDFFRMIWTFQWALNYTLVYFVLIFGTRSSCKEKIATKNQRIPKDHPLQSLWHCYTPLIVPTKWRKKKNLLIKKGSS